MERPMLLPAPFSKHWMMQNACLNASKGLCVNLNPKNSDLRNLGFQLRSFGAFLSLFQSKFRLSSSLAFLFYRLQDPPHTIPLHARPFMSHC